MRGRWTTLTRIRIFITVSVRQVDRVDPEIGPLSRNARTVCHHSIGIRCDTGTFVAQSSERHRNSPEIIARICSSV